MERIYEPEGSVTVNNNQVTVIKVIYGNGDKGANGTPPATA